MPDFCFNPQAQHLLHKSRRGGKGTENRPAEKAGKSDNGGNGKSAKLKQIIVILMDEIATLYVFIYCGM